ncbi:MAG: alpha/beta hydrolase [Methanomicrobiales archaeon]|nr:alpha/beta hydrolase [Methanomicrobiales archaeon]
MTVRYALPDLNTLLMIDGTRSFLLAGKAGSRFPLCIEYASGEICTTLETDDIIAVSAPEGGALEPAVMLLELVRRYHLPLLVLPSEHPGSKRLRYVVSAGPEISLSCAIQRGTHPDQHLLCSSDELAGVVLRGRPGHIETGDLPPGVHAHLVRLSLRLDQETPGDLTHP